MSPASEKILLIGDRDRNVHESIALALPDVPIVRASSVFDGLAELHSQPFSAVVAAVEPIERRPEPAVLAMRSLLGDRARLLLFGNSTLEPLSRKMLAFGCDDYFVTPADPAELRQIFSAPRETPIFAPLTDQSPDGATTEALLADTSRLLCPSELLALCLEMLLQQPQATVAQLVARLSDRLPPGMNLKFTTKPPVESQAISVPVRDSHEVVGHVQLLTASAVSNEDEPAYRSLLHSLAPTLNQVAQLEERHALMQRLAITDDLTGLYNGRYFNHFLTKILEKARAKRFAVTLLLFDIDNFKRYNDQFGHGMGDEILRQTASLMKRCCRDHDLVARIGGDEFAVVFWEKDAPRVPRDPTRAGHSRVPSTPMIIAQRFRKLLGSSEFSALGPAGKGVLTISGGMAVYPFDGQTPADLIKAADTAQMFGAKKSGKNSIALVGEGGMFVSGE
jgi:GGDEF domain-containing protein